jgi:hypothetical protein
LKGDCTYPAPNEQIIADYEDALKRFISDTDMGDGKESEKTEPPKPIEDTTP